MVLRFIETDIIIDAPADAVWGVLSDLASWPDWHPFVVSVTGTLRPGRKVVLEKGSSGGRTMSVKRTVSSVEEDVELRLVGHLGPRGVLDNEHRFRVEPIDDDHSRFIQGQAFRGLLVRLLVRKRGAASYAVFDEINEAIKRRVEGG